MLARTVLLSKTFYILHRKMLGKFQNMFFLPQIPTGSVPFFCSHFIQHYGPMNGYGSTSIPTLKMNYTLIYMYASYQIKDLLPISEMLKFFWSTAHFFWVDFPTSCYLNLKWRENTEFSRSAVKGTSSMSWIYYLSLIFIWQQPKSSIKFY